MGSGNLGSAERELVRELARYALRLRITLVAVHAALILLTGSAAGLAWTGAMTALLLAWCVLLHRRLRTGERGWVAFGVDASMVVLVGLGQVGWPGSINWCLALAGLTAILVQYEWTSRPWVGLSLALIAGAGVVCGQALCGPAGVFTALLGLRLMVEGALAQLSYVVMRSYARTADRFTGRAAQRRREVDVARARRTAEREYLATLHDTASATLLMAGVAAEVVVARAKHDLAALVAVPGSRQGRVDLVPLLRSVAAQHGVDVDLRVPDSMVTTAAAADAVANGLREALANVDRHAGVREARLSARAGDAFTVRLCDQGRGFDRDRVPEQCRGISGSIERRMRESGGSVSVRSTPGEGTEVCWEVPDLAGRDAPGRGARGREIYSRLIMGMRLSLLLVTGTVQFGFCSTQLLAFLGEYRWAWAEVVAFVLLAAVAVAATCSVATGRSGTGRARWWGLAVVLAAACLGFAGLTPDQYLRTAHWSFGLIGWYGLLLLFDRPARTLVAFFAGYVVLTLVPVALLSELSRADLAMMGMVSVSVCGYQLAVALFGHRLQGLASSTEAAAVEEERLRTEEVIAESTHRDHQQRYAELRDTTVPLLAGLADGTLDPSTVDVQRRCALEAVRMRRLLAESEGVADQLLHELRTCVDGAQRNGIRADLAVRGEPRELDREVRRALLDPVLTVLSHVGEHARVTLLRTADEVRVSVIGDAPGDVLIATATDHVRVTKLPSEENLWVESATRATTGSASR